MAQKQPEKYIGETEKNLSRLQEGEYNEWITTTDAAALTGYNAEHIRRLIRGGKVNAKKWGRDWMVDQKSLLAYIQDEGRGPKRKNMI